MKFLIVSSAPLIKDDDSFTTYAPYSKELSLWYSDGMEVQFCCPFWKSSKGLLTDKISFKIDRIFELRDFNLRSFSSLFLSVSAVIFNLFQIFKGMRQADHIHLRCPGNIGLLGCIVQIFFPSKRKTAKYAGNWDWNSKQPWSYKLQQIILRNTFITKNMQVLVYGDWGETKNIKPFFTASYSEKEIIETPPRTLDISRPIQFIFVGGLNIGKRPMLSLEVIKKLRDHQVNCEIHFYGEGNERNQMAQYIARHQLKEYAFLHGNVESDVIKKAFQECHFLLFISKSEGWPKVVAESMFWGCLPLTSAVSCVPEMIGNGDRGEIIAPDADLIIQKIQYYINNPVVYHDKCQQAMIWSRAFTLEKFEKEVKDLL